VFARQVVPAMVAGAVAIPLLALSMLAPTLPTAEGGSAQTPAGGPSACSGTVSRELSADTIRLCDAATITSVIEAACVGCAGGLDVVFVQIGHGPQNVVAQNQEALRILDVVKRFPEVRPAVGVVHYFLSSSRVMLDLTTDLDAAKRPLGLPRNHIPGWGMDHAGAARLAVRMLERGRPSSALGSPPPCRIVVYFALVIGGSTGEGPREAAAFQSAVNMIRGAGARVFVGCPLNPGAPGSNLCDEPQRIGGRDYAQTTGSGALARLVERGMAADGKAPEVAGLSLLQVMPTGLSYERSGALPEPNVSPVAGGTSLAWAWAAPQSNQPQTVTYRLRPLAEGAWSITASLTITDQAGAAIVVPAQPVTLTVSGLCLTPTAPPSPTATASPTSTATEPPEETATTTPTATATATPRPGALFLPLALVERCDPAHKRADVALVIDTSGSMSGRKLADAKVAAVSFVDQMDLAPGRDQVAVVRFDTEAEVACRLTNARAIIEAAIHNLTPRSGTHIDAGLRTALAELQSPRHIERNMPVMILLTDGVQTGTPGEELRAAAEVRAAGVRLYTVGLGADVDVATLRDMAGDDARYHFAPDSSDLARIYGEIASDIFCPGPPGGFWPGR